MLFIFVHVGVTFRPVKVLTFADVSSDCRARVSHAPCTQPKVADCCTALVTLVTLRFYRLPTATVLLLSSLHGKCR